MATAVPPPTKRAKLDADDSSTALPVGFEECLGLFKTYFLPESITSGGKTKNSIDKARKLFDDHGFRTSVVTSPRSALSIYKDSCHLEDGDESNPGKMFLLAMLGMHPEQLSIERWYETCAKNAHCLLLFCEKIRQVCPKAVSEELVQSLLASNEALCRSVHPSNWVDPSRSPKTVAPDAPVEEMHRISTSVPEKVAELITAIIAADSRIRSEQLEHEYERITLWNSTYANALVQIFLDAHDACIKDIYFKRSHLPKYERISIYLYDPDIDLLKPPRFTFLPSVRRALDDGPEAVVEDMVETFWSSLLRHGYFATERIKSDFTPELKKYFLSGISHDPTIPLLLNAHFSPKYPLSFYLVGKAGAGKSSFVRNFSPALNAAIEVHADPEMVVRFVKQNLNKPFKDLELELELRPNNNDLSVMSIIQGRRMTMSQSKPGLVVVDLEEMPSNVKDANPNQLKTAQLISQRFSGRNGEYREDAKAPRNSAKRGISGDATLITLFTSNYDLEKPCADALQRLEMFSNVKQINMTAVSGEDRVQFAHTYITQCIRDYFCELQPECSIQLKIPVGSGDTRPLVRHIRMLGFFVCALAADSVTLSSTVNPTITQDAESHITRITTGQRSIDLRLGSFENLYPMPPQVFDKRAGLAIEELRGLINTSTNFSELSQIIDFYFAKTLAPAVIVSQDAGLIKNLVKAVGMQQDVHTISDVEAGEYKMMKSLYDKENTPNLRDDILRFGKGAFVAIELVCNTVDAQLCIREIVEDSPSMTAFSTNKSALYKSGLLFGVYVAGDITPEIRSRASLIL